MTGKNTMSINKATAIEAMQEWLKKKRKKRWITRPPTVTGVEVVKGSYEWALVLTLEGGEEPEAPDE